MAEHSKLPTLTFDYEYVGRGWAEARISDGVNSCSFAPSYVLNDPLGELVEAVAALLRGEQEARCRWWNEPSEARWILRREGDALRISVLYFRDFQVTVNRPQIAESGKTAEFSTVCDFWKFAAKVRLYASRFIASTEDR